MKEPNIELTMIEDFEAEVAQRIIANSENVEFNQSAAEFLRHSTLPKYSYNFSWLGRPIIQYPQDVIAIQELIWTTKPDLIIETGIAHGGSSVLYASMLALLDITEKGESEGFASGSRPKRQVVSVDIDIRKYNRDAIESHPLGHRIQMLEGSSTSKFVVDEVIRIAQDYQSILVCLDSNHTKEHVLAELNAYANLVTVGNYCVVFDTMIEDFPEEILKGKSWGSGNSPKNAVAEYLASHPEFSSDDSIPDKLMITACPGGYLKRIT